MRKILSVLIAVGILSSVFVGCGTSGQEKASNGENSSTVVSNEKNNKEEVKKEEDTKEKDEAKESKVDDSVTVKAGIITIPENLKLAEIMLNYNGRNPLEVKEIKDYGTVENEDMRYGVIIGDEPLKVSSIDNDWNYNTLVTKFNTIKYPNFFEIQKEKMPNLEFGITLKSKDKQMEFSLGSYMNNSGNDAKQEFENQIQNFSQNGKVVNKNQEENTFSFTVEKDGFMEYHFGFIKDKNSYVNTFTYKYEDTFNKIIEESKKSLVTTREFSKLADSNSNKEKESSKSNNNQTNDSTETIDITKYRLTPEEVLKLFYKNNPERIKKQNEIDKFLIENYKNNDIIAFSDNMDTVLNKFGDNIVYIEKPECDIFPVAYIGSEPIYMFSGWAQVNTTFYMDSKGNYDGNELLLNAFEDRTLYRFEDGKKLKVTKRPSFNNRGYLLSYNAEN